MAKRRSKGSAKKNAPSSISPLNSSIANEDKEEEGVIGSTTAQQQKEERSGGDDDDNKDKDYNKMRKPRAMLETRVMEEAALTERLFGGSSSAGGAAWNDDDDDDILETNTQQVSGDDDEGNNNAANGGGGGGELFAIDRSGEEVTDDVEEEETDEKQSDDYQALNGDDEESDDESFEEEMDGENQKASMTGAAWQDSDSSDSESDDGSDSDEESTEAKSSKKKKGVSLVDGPNRLKKLRRYRDETNPLSFKEYELRLRERFVNTASVAARTDWADVGLAEQQGEVEGGEPQKKKKRGYGSSSEEESSDDEYTSSAARTILESNASLFESSTKSLALPPTLLDIIRTRDVNLTDPNNSVVSACQFHSGSDEDQPLLMTAGMDKMLRFFRVNPDEKEGSTKIHGIQFPDMPITCASFLGDTGSVVVSGRRPFFYVYDALSGNIQKIPSIVGRKERSLEKFSVSPDGRVIAFVGNDGYVILVDGKTRQWIGDLKMNGSVRSITFSGDSEYVLASGSDGDVYRWHIGSRRCVERFHNEDGTITSSLAMSNNFLAVGAESGVVNLYNDKHTPLSSRGLKDGLSLTATQRNPLKSIMNLTTSADSMQFNPTGEILAISSRRETNGLKLLHVPTATVFSNWPTSKTPLKYVWSMDFSPGSKYMAVGNDHGKCLLYKLKHYCDE